jgi:hypothetical protein
VESRSVVWLSRSMVDLPNRFDPNDPAVQILLLAQRVENLGKEKESIERELERERAEREKVARNLEDRVAKIEGSLGKGAGILIGLAAIGTVGGTLMAYGKTIFAPWLKQ